MNTRKLIQTLIADSLAVASVALAAPDSRPLFEQTPRLAKLASEGMRLPGADAELTPPSGRKPKAAAPAPPRKPRRSKGASKSATAIPLTPDDILLADFEGDTYFPAVIPHRIPTRT